MFGFIEDEVLGMRWLERAVGRGLTWAGVDVGSRLGGSLQFFLYDCMKILALLCVLIYGISLVQSYFPPERSRRMSGGGGGLDAPDDGLAVSGAGRLADVPGDAGAVK